MMWIQGKALDIYLHFNTWWGWCDAGWCLSLSRPEKLVRVDGMIDGTKGMEILENLLKMQESSDWERGSPSSATTELNT